MRGSRRGRPHGAEPHPHAHHRRGHDGATEGGAEGERVRGRLLSGADLQLLILSLLAERPRHGYQIIKAIYSRTGGYYSPSAGMVYPALNELVNLGYASFHQEGSRKLYGLSDAGRAAVAEKGERVAEVLADLAQRGEQSQQRVAVLADAPQTSTKAAADALEAAVRDLKAALFDVLFASSDEKQRVAEILRRATAEIIRR
jgi:DNA-binding PadR family transcriptional regulator